MGAWQLRNPERFLLSQARTRARNKGLPFTIECSDIIIPAVCPILGIPLFMQRGCGHSKSNSPSIDRLIPARGYVKDNIIVVSWRANSLKKDATLSELELVYRGYARLMGKDLT